MMMMMVVVLRAGRTIYRRLEHQTIDHISWFRQHSTNQRRKQIQSAKIETSFEPLKMKSHIKNCLLGRFSSPRSTLPTSHSFAHSFYLCWCSLLFGLFPVSSVWHFFFRCVIRFSLASFHPRIGAFKLVASFSRSATVLAAARVHFFYLISFAFCFFFFRFNCTIFDKVIRSACCWVLRAQALSLSLPVASTHS